MDGLSFGGGCVNDTVLHLSSHHAPFGGVGDSGMGAYHGRHGFDAFSHPKTILSRGGLDLPLRYPPYRRAALNLLKKIM
ncbi:Coniferyl aldehyde dehydrogenase [bioreactor metagenome]|uniref:Coniferyl aldehyde dehydrogenase n=1 Tax=bioreactor metagenome TaxID=1076179 RepID=A0A645G800_9ZZZZ